MPAEDKERPPLEAAPQSATSRDAGEVDVALLGEQDQKAIVHSNNQASSDEIDPWIVETSQLIASAVGVGEVTRFLSNAGLSGVQITQGMTQDDATNLAYRRQRLADLISRVDMLAIEPSFDPV